MAWSLEEAVAYYGKMGAPRDQSALVSLLREIQQEQGGGIPEYMLHEVAGIYGVQSSLLLALVRRIPSLRLADRHTLQLCAGVNCGKHRALAEVAEKLTARDERIRLEFTPCMRMCGKGPNLRFDGKLYNQADENLLCRLVEETKKV